MLFTSHFYTYLFHFIFYYASLCKTHWGGSPTVRSGPRWDATQENCWGGRSAWFCVFWGRFGLFDLTLGRVWRTAQGLSAHGVKSASHGPAWGYSALWEGQAPKNSWKPAGGCFRQELQLTGTFCTHNLVNTNTIFHTFCLTPQQCPRPLRGDVREKQKCNYLGQNSGLIFPRHTFPL